MSEKVIIIGASGHGKVIADIIIKSGDQIMGFLDNDVQKENIMGFPVLGNRELIEKYKNHYFIIAIGDNKTRENFAEKYSNLNYYTAIH
ncbi:MAG: sialic acid O-acetyltransferase NeuD family sugar O-acyltransferase, partial [Eubacterium sp.]